MGAVPGWMYWMEHIRIAEAHQIPFRGLNSKATFLRYHSRIDLSLELLFGAISPRVFLLLLKVRLQYTVIGLIAISR